MDRKIYKFPFSQVGLTRIPCPRCASGLLRHAKDSFHSKELVNSKAAHNEDWWDPEFIELTFCCLFTCSNSLCKETIACAGTGSVQQDYGYDEPEITYNEYFKPKFFWPHLKFFRFPKSTPDNVSSEINKSFELVFSDASSAANHIRIALEHLLTMLKVKRLSTRGGRRTYLALHNRIDLLPTRLSDLKELFLAIKWLGNAGSHSNTSVEMDDIFDAFELMEELLKVIYANESKRLRTLAQKINKKKGPK